jgi:hypothetical protein
VTSVRGVAGVATMAALKALAAGYQQGQVMIHGYYAAYDGGGLYAWNPTSTAAGDDALVVVPNTNPATGRWERVEKEVMRVEAFGVAVSQSGATNRPRLVAALNSGVRHLIFDAEGDYLYDNSTGAVGIYDFEGRITMGPKARLVMTDNVQGGITFVGGTGLVVEGLHLTYTTLPTVRQPAHQLLRFQEVTDARVIDLRVNGSVNFGCLFELCIRPHTYSTQIRNTMGDGMTFGNCEDWKAINHHAYNTGDDGLACVNHAHLADLAGGYASGIICRDINWARGIAMIGARDVVVDGFVVDNTEGQGVLVAGEQTERKPRNVKLQNGVIKNGGNKTATKSLGLVVDNADSADISNVKVLTPGTLGIGGANPVGKVTLRNCRVEGTTGTWAACAPTASELILEDIVVSDSGGSGIAILSCGTLIAKGLTAIDTSKNDTLRRAIWIEANTRVFASELTIIDLQTTPTGYVLQIYGAQSGAVTDVHWLIPNGSLTIENNSNLPLGQVNGRPAKRVSADRGDASVTLTMTDAFIQRFATTLTANRTVTLPTTGVYNGATFRVVRTGLGAFTLNVGGLKTIPSSTAAFVEVTHDGTAWRLTGYGVL